MTRQRVRDLWGPARPRCAARGCTAAVPKPEQLLCAEHYFDLPGRLRARVAAVADWRRAPSALRVALVREIETHRLAERRAAARGQGRLI